MIKKIITNTMVAGILILTLCVPMMITPQPKTNTQGTTIQTNTYNITYSITSYNSNKGDPLFIFDFSDMVERYGNYVYFGGYDNDKENLNSTKLLNIEQANLLFSGSGNFGSGYYCPDKPTFGDCGIRNEPGSSWKKFNYNVEMSAAWFLPYLNTGIGLLAGIMTIFLMRTIIAIFSYKRSLWTTDREI